MPRRTEALQPTPERVRHAGDDGIVEIDTAQAGIKAHRTRDMLERYYNRCELAPGNKGENARRYMAGVRLREAHDRSGRDSLPVVGLMSVDGTRDPERRMAGVIDRGWELHRMLEQLGECRGAAYDCCCLGLALGPGASMERLRAGLARLADRLGIP